MWNTVNGNLLFVCQGHNDSVVSCDVSADGRLIASASTDKSLMVSFVYLFHLYFEYFCPNNACLIGTYFYLKIWNSSNGNRLLHLNRYGACIRTCKFSPNGYLLASGDDNGSVKVIIR